MQMRIAKPMGIPLHEKISPMQQNCNNIVKTMLFLMSDQRLTTIRILMSMWMSSSISSNTNAKVNANFKGNIIVKRQ